MCKFITREHKRRNHRTTNKRKHLNVGSTSETENLRSQQESLDLDQSTRAAACAALPPRHVITAASMIPTAICRLRSLPHSSQAPEAPGNTRSPVLHSRCSRGSGRRVVLCVRAPRVMRQWGSAAFAAGAHPPTSGLPGTDGPPSSRARRRRLLQDAR